jgi:hypothetical protein
MLTLAQLQAIKAAILADPTLASHSMDGDGNGAIADAMNVLASPVVFAWRTNVPVQEVFDTIDWTKYTPSDAGDATVTYSNRLLLIQTKQMNLQNILIGRDSIDASKPNVRAGLRDSVIQLPAGAAGAYVTAAGANASTLLGALIRKATRAEALLASGTATTGPVTASLLTFQGLINSTDIDQARHAA